MTGYKKSQNRTVPEYSDKATDAYDISKLKPEFIIEIFERSMPGEEYQISNFDIGIVDVEIDVNVTEVEPEAEMLELISKRMIQKMTPLQIKALGLHSKAVLYKLQDNDDANDDEWLF